MRALLRHEAPFHRAGRKNRHARPLRQPAEVGADRIVNSVAAFEKYGGPCISVDFGTATTSTASPPKANTSAASSAPGIGISAEALFGRTARLPRVEIRQPARIIGTNTVSSMQSGLYYGYLGMVDAILERLLAEMGKDCKVVATGGLATLLSTSFALHQAGRRLTLRSKVCASSGNATRHAP